MSSVKIPLRVLLVEDSVDDQLLIARELRRGGFEPALERVDTQPAFLAALERGPWDVIISDHSLPEYNGLTALDDVRNRGLDIPFILASGTIGEDIAVAAMKRGAQDFVLKDQLARLPAAVERELGDARTRADRERMRAYLVISERMASAGVLAAGIAHEINNPLAVLFANLELVHEELERAHLHLQAVARDPAIAVDPGVHAPLVRCFSEVEEPLRDAREAASRIRDIVRDVKLFSAPQEARRGPIDVRRVMESSLRMAWNEIRHRARLVKDYGDVPMVEANEGHLGQVLLNLVVNAAQAMPEGGAATGVITIATRACGGKVLIEVRDTGSGISTANLDRIFDPFFTTKPAGTGTGLGLAICHRIVKDLGGSIDVESELGVGTLFRITLLAAESAPVAPSTAVSEQPARRRGKILVLDDEISIVRLLARTLAAHHDVITMTSGREALVRIGEGERFDVILSDLMMPDLTGMDVHAALARDVPDQAARMIFLTGGAFTATARAFLAGVQNPTIEKPFTIPAVLAAIANRLAS